MTNRLSLLAFAALAATVTGFLSVGCHYCTFDLERKPSEPLELDVDADLLAMSPLGDWIGDREYQYLAVGEGGTIVVWGTVYERKTSASFVEASQLGDEDLRGVWVDAPDSDYYYGESNAWWVVGDAGTIAVSDNLGASWNPVVLPDVGADLHAITGHAGRPVIVGDDIVLVRLADGTWTRPTPPAEGWGSLRGVASDGELVYAVGLAGTMWMTTDPSGEWTAVPFDVDIDLFDVEPRASSWSALEDPSGVTVVGEAGTLMFYDAGSWDSVDIDVSADLIDVDRGGCILAADGNVYEIGPEPIDSIPGATAVACDWFDIASVGANGLATVPPPQDC